MKLMRHLNEKYHRIYCSTYSNGDGGDDNPSGIPVDPEEKRLFA